MTFGIVYYLRIYLPHVPFLLKYYKWLEWRKEPRILTFYSNFQFQILKSCGIYRTKIL